MEYFLSVDAGGSKAVALVTTSDLEVVSIQLSGPMNVVENGEAIVRLNLRRIGEILEALPRNRVVHSCFGMPALGEFENSEAYLRSIIVEEVGIEPQLLVNDVVVGWAAGTMGRDGVHVVAGTGTIAYGRKGSAEFRSGGWGSLIGDEGSAYDIGKETLRRVCRQIDGREPETLLKGFLMEKLGIREWWELSNWVYSKPCTERRPIIASIAKLTDEASQMGDPVATKILKNAGREIALCAYAVCIKLRLPDPLVTYSGSVLIKSVTVEQEFKAKLKDLLPNARVQKAVLHPVVGGIILLFQKLMNVSTISEDIFEKMKLLSVACEKALGGDTDGERS